MTHAYAALAAVLFGACGSDPVKPLPPVTPRSPEAKVEPKTVTPAPAKALVPRSKAGLLVYTIPKQEGNTMRGYGPLSLIPAEPGARSVLAGIVDAQDVVVGPHVIATRRFETNKFSMLDLRGPEVQIRPSEAVEYITPDDHLVSRCSGGMGEPFAICITDADGTNRRELFREAAGPDTGVVMGASATHVFGWYSASRATTKPFAITIADAKRAALALSPPKTDDSFDPVMSPNGAVLGECVSTPNGQVFAYADTKPASKTRTVALGAGPNCECVIAPDASTAVCTLTGGDSRLVTIDLKSGKATTIAKVHASDLAFSPDGKGVAFVAIEGEKVTLRLLAIDGKLSVEVASFPELIRLYGWTQPTQ